MQEWVPAVTMLGLALIIGTALVLRGPMGKALAEWIRGWSKTDEPWLAFKAAKQGVTLGGDPERLRAELGELRHRLTEVEERLASTERLISQKRDPQWQATPPPHHTATHACPSPSCPRL